MKSEKEIIKEIVNRLNTQPDRLYREGAWENFNKKHNDNGTKVRRIKYWASAAAAMLLLGMGGLYMLKNDHRNTTEQPVELASGEQLDNIKNGGSAGQGLDENIYVATPELTPQKGNTIDHNIDLTAAKGADDITQAKRKEHLSLIVDANTRTLSTLQLSPNENVTLTQYIDTKGIESNSKIYAANLKANKTPLNIPNELVLASKSMPTAVINLREVDNLNKSNNFKLTDKFDLGLFVSPFATGDKMNIGGGMTLAYNLTKKLSIRTGASYNSYEVGMLKNPTEAASAETIVVYNSPNTSKNTISAAPAQSKMILPNINAVTSVVQSLDIPLELKYNVGKSLYATAGVSYSAIIGQERNAHYIDNINSQTFTDGFPENEMQQSNTVRAVTKTVKSAEPNVNTNGFNGFVNFSLGKKVKVNNQFGVSMEPYVKIPVGQYRRADMDYTNGGIRVMTNF